MAHRRPTGGIHDLPRFNASATMGFTGPRPDARKDNALSPAFREA
jgi:hypothetical protein